MQRLEEEQKAMLLRMRAKPPKPARITPPEPVEIFDKFCIRCKQHKTHCLDYCKKCYQRNVDLKRRYKINLAEYDTMARKQKGKCLLCHRKMPRPALDHCHKTKQIRGLLCDGCNGLVSQVENRLIDPARIAAYILGLIRCTPTHICDNF